MNEMKTNRTEQKNKPPIAAIKVKEMKNFLF